MKFTHGRGKYAKRTLTEANVTEVRYALFTVYLSSLLQVPELYISFNWLLGFTIFVTIKLFLASVPKTSNLWVHLRVTVITAM